MLRIVIVTLALVVGVPEVYASCAVRTYPVAMYRSGPGTLTRLPGTAISGTVEVCLPSGTVLSFAAAPNEGAIFNGWSGGACSGTGLSCTITTLATRMTVSATFRQPQITVQLGNAVSGRVNSSPAGIACGDGSTNCLAQFAPGSQVTLTADGGQYATFTGWQLGAGVVTQNPVTVTMTGDRIARALFSDPRKRLTLNVGGHGTIYARTNTYACPPTCARLYMPGSEESMRAVASSGEMFERWVNCPMPIGDSCTVVMSEPLSIWAYFSMPQISVTIAGTGRGRVTSNPVGLDCALGTCTGAFAAGRQITLTAGQGGPSMVPSRFDGWSEPACQTAPPSTTCTITMDRLTRNITATFTLVSAPSAQVE